MERLTQTQKNQLMDTKTVPYLCGWASQWFSTLRISRAKYLLNSLGCHHGIQKHADTTITPQPTNNFICLPPRHSLHRRNIKGKRLFPLFPGKWILYQLCVCKSDLRFPESRGITLISFTVFVKAQQYRLQLLRFPTCLPWIHVSPVTASIPPLE